MFVVVDRESGLRPGERAPDFTLPAVQHTGTVSLADFRGKSPVFLAIFRGLYCPFCRHAIANLGRAYARLTEMGVEALGVVATKVENARLYVRHRPTALPLVADPDCLTHRAYRIPRPVVTPEIMKAIHATPTNATGELPEPLPLMEAGAALNMLHGYPLTPTDTEERETQFGQIKAQFLIDRDGIIRWRNVECANDGLEGFGRFPTNDEVLKIGRAFA